jgi:hypothetical protein
MMQNKQETKPEKAKKAPDGSRTRDIKISVHKSLTLYRLSYGSTQLTTASTLTPWLILKLTKAIYVFTICKMAPMNVRSVSLYCLRDDYDNQTCHHKRLRVT